MRTFRKEVCNIYLLAVVTILPVLFRYNYQDLGGMKAMFYLLMAGILIICGLIAQIVMYASDKSMGIDPPPIRETLKTLSPLDWSVLAFGIIVFLSTFTTRYTLKATLIAEQAIFVGGMVLLFLVLSFFIFSRGADLERKSYIVGFYISSFIVILVGILNHMLIDPLGMHKGNAKETIRFMTSTIGNVDHFYGYLPLVLIFFAAYRADEEDRRFKIAEDVLLVICYIALWTARASGAFAGLTLAVPLLGYLGLGSFRRLVNLFWQGILAGIGGLAAEILHHFNGDLYYGIEMEFSGKFLFMRLYLPIGIACLVIWFLLKNLEQKGKSKDLESALRKLRMPYAVLVSVAFVCLVGVITLVPKGQEFTGRAFIWNDMKPAFAQGSLREKLIGVGPGCLDPALERLSLRSTGELVYETAHNFLWEYCFTTGILGVCAYISMIVTFFYSFFKTASDAPYEREITCCALLVAAHIGQSLTNGPNPTPVIIAATFGALFRRYQIPETDEF